MDEKTNNDDETETKTVMKNKEKLAIKKNRRSSSIVPPRIPYRTIFKPDSINNIYLGNLPIEAKIINYEETSFIFSPYIYHIELNHGHFNWIIKRRFNQFRQLHNQIRMFYTKLAIPLPTENSRQNRKILERFGEIEWPKFPFLPEMFYIADGISRRIKILEDYLRFLLGLSLFRHHPSLLQFLSISPYSFIEDLGLKGEEILVKKRAGGFRSATYCVRIENFFTDLTGHWRKRWLVVKDTCLFYLEPHDKKIHYVMLFDPDFYADSGIKETGITFGVRIRNMSRQLVMKCFTAKQAKELADYLNEYSRINAKEFVQRNRFGSYVPVRKSIHSQWFVDGCAYFEAVSQAMDMAKEEIFITDWWLSPEIYLQRPSLGLDWRLDRLLWKKACSGVRIFILLYKEMEIGISINSIYTKRTLMKMHENIAVLRHPDAVRGGPLLWSHHEKLVIIDQQVAFVGGIDLCFGRWDNFEHLLIDQGGIFFKTQPNDIIRNSTRPNGLLYRSISQPFLADISLETSDNNSPISKETIPTAGNGGGKFRKKRSITTNAVSIANNDKQNGPIKMVGDDTIETRSVADIEEILIENENISRRSSSSSSTVDNDGDDDDADYDEIDEEQQVKKVISQQMKGNFFSKNRITRKLRAKQTRAMTRLRRIRRRIRRRVRTSKAEEISIISTDEDSNVEITPDFFKQSIPRVQNNNDDVSYDELEGAAKLWIGKDYTNFIVKDFTHLNMPFQDSIDRNTTPRMPWHDVSCVVIGDAARDVARHFIERWNHTKFSKAKFKERYPWLIPKTYRKNLLITTNANVTDGQIEMDQIPPYLTRAHRVRCQTLRSVSSWSIGNRQTEASIVDAYIEVINQAEHYIYIENQFFISQTKTHLEYTDLVKNRIAEALYRRILRAFRNGHTFRVFILIPLLPAFEGEVGTSSGTAIQQIMHYNYSTICKGYDSLMAKLSLEIDDPSQYIGFYSLRNHTKLNGRLVTELIYIHSKILIADDKISIIGSANINDRSMLGNRDSEVCVIIEDEEYDFFFMNEKPYKSGKFSGSLRRMLMREHLGIYKENKEDMLKMTDLVNDPISDQFWNKIWNARAKENTEIYEKVFPIIPTDDVRKLSDINIYLGREKLYKTDQTKAEEMLSLIKGHLVMLPLQFLCEELQIIYSAQDRFIPQIIWT
uniref:Phospholipase n=1 Tax=Dermatophagoides pteronyssinus TaxID=6956 RepID=A0A6P6XS34_DERPT|nr:phospholipase D1-like isoform X2 [Dermatophagoides pteronyssinus]